MRQSRVCCNKYSFYSEAFWPAEDKLNKLRRKAGTGFALAVWNYDKIVQALAPAPGGSELWQAMAGIALCGAPLALFGEWFARRPEPLAAIINQDTKLLTLQVFGTLPQPIAVGVVASQLSLWTAVTEEAAFRGAVLPTLAGSDLGVGGAYLVSSALFGVVHWGGDFTKEAAVLVALQSGYGLAFGACYLLTGGSLLAPIAAHWAYDFWTLLGTHLLVSTQVKYANAEVKETPEEAADVAAIAKQFELEERFVRLTRVVFLWLDTDRDGLLDTNELRIGLCAMGQPGPSEADAEDAMQSVDSGDAGVSFAQFLRLVVRLEMDPVVTVKSLLY
ncbi:hypothetical protein CYMTET_12886 [Cymbomonas tetramitiformis]|uniref:CAAX prenyl protease 2/Lysostaphin resistance protein A-like domain-containing protein n=1 Tax=Cymbomonas tetramitiformis TaxID=36881 RepID=A0AAE0GJT1_9CHLO|nr:hypothetical protein CYMTET_12886 [Cymbomonas tetramitiformis]